MADNLVFEESLNTEIDSSEFISKKWVYVNDNNVGNYTSQVVIDSTPLSNAGQWINWSEAFIMMPLVVQLTSQTASSISTSVNTTDWTWAFKNGYWNILNSMTVEFNNQNVVQQTPFLNVFRSFKAMTSFSLDDVVNVGSDIGFYPDSSTSWSYNNANNTATIGRGVNAGIQNNANNPRTDSTYNTETSAVLAGNAYINYGASGVAGYAYYGAETTSSSDLYPVQYQGAPSNGYLITTSSNYNDGLLKRQEYFNFDTTYSGLNQNAIYNTASCKQIYKNFSVTSAGSVYWNIFAKLRLKDLADFFEKMPLLKGSTIRFYINTNQTSVSFNTTNGAVNGVDGNQQGISPALQVTNVNTIGGLTNPFIIASNEFGQGCSSLIPDNYVLSVSIYKNNFPLASGSSAQQATCALQSCRLYAPLYTMNPLAESKYLSLTPTKKIMYKDIFQYQFNNISGPFNILVTNGISNIQSVLVVPFLSKSQTISTVTGIGTTPGTGSSNITSLTGVSTGPLQFSAAQNPFSTAPATPDPIAITNFNILVSGVNLFLNNENYDFEAFSQQLSNSNQLNGGLTTGLASGLIGPKDFASLYRYYYGDASRILPSEEGVSRSVQIVGQISNSNLAVDLMIFVEFMKEITIDISTGARIE